MTSADVKQPNPLDLHHSIAYQKIMAQMAEPGSFGARGAKRKRIDFVPASSESDQVLAPNTSKGSLGDRYLSIVFPKGTPLESFQRNKNAPPSSQASSTPSKLVPEKTCDICKLPMTTTSSDSDAPHAAPTKPHETSLAHQVCLENSYPPSHLDRNRQGLKYLASYGWDPDSRLGLGASGDGILVPIRTTLKNDTVGLGVVVPERRGKKVVERLDAKQTRKREWEGKKKKERLQEMFYRSEDVERYLGGG